MLLWGGKITGKLLNEKKSRMHLLDHSPFRTVKKAHILCFHILIYLEFCKCFCVLNSQQMISVAPGQETLAEQGHLYRLASRPHATEG